MTGNPTPEFSPLLTHGQRLRLRPDVDADALERLLGRAAGEIRPFLLRHCELDVFPIEAREAGVEPDAATRVRNILDQWRVEGSELESDSFTSDVRFSLESDELSPLYSDVFPPLLRQPAKTPKLRDLAARIPYCRAPRVHIDHPSAPDLDHFRAPVELPIRLIDASDATQWPVVRSTLIPGGNVLEMKIPPGSRSDVPRQEEQPSPIEGEYLIFSWGVESATNNVYNGFERDFSVWTGGEAAYPTALAASTLWLERAEEFRIESPSGTIACLAYTVITEDAKRQMHVDAYWDDPGRPSLQAAALGCADWHTAGFLATLSSATLVGEVI
jgi:hypothetical protein